MNNKIIENFSVEDLMYIKKMQKWMRDIEKRVNKKKLNEIFKIKTKIF